ncbi:unnamed protein product [Meganyctiphanes norvegica]|uniref:Uncharacterized protein n=1 Tax=Meganyctiphanes norvegica TaxID=48144 RepID=A0AAV2RHF9_MEGNR
MRGIFRPTVNLSGIKCRELSCLVRQQMDVNFMQNRAYFFVRFKDTRWRSTLVLSTFSWCLLECHLLVDQLCQAYIMRGVDNTADALQLFGTIGQLRNYI